MTAWLLIIVLGPIVFTVPSVATQADCDKLAATMAQVFTIQKMPDMQHSCVSYEQASSVSEVHIFGPNERRPERPPQGPQLRKPAAKAR